MKKIAYLAPMALLAACATPQEQIVVTPVSHEPEVKVIEKPVYVIPPQPVNLEALKPKKRVDPITATRQANRNSILMPQPERFNGATLEYPLIEGYTYDVLTAPNHITSVELPPGCRFIAKSPYVGDKRSYTPAYDPSSGEPPEPEPNWEVVKSAHGSKTAPVSKVIIRPRIEGLKTTLQADTDCGAFSFNLTATATVANRTVRFRKELSEMGYPEAPVAEERGSDAAPVASGCDNMPVSSAVFGYEVSGDRPVWAPTASQIFHNGKKDGGKTCIKMSDALAADEYPTAFVTLSGKEATIYGRVTERGFMEFDKVLPSVYLRIGDDTVKVSLKR